MQTARERGASQPYHCSAPCSSVRRWLQDVDLTTARARALVFPSRPVVCHACIAQRRDLETWSSICALGRQTSGSASGTCSVCVGGSLVVRPTARRNVCPASVVALGLVSWVGSRWGWGRQDLSDETLCGGRGKRVDYSNVKIHEYGTSTGRWGDRVYQCLDESVWRA